MKTIYLLFVVITNSQGYESMHNLDGVRYKSLDLCLVEKAKYVEVMKSSSLTKNKINFIKGVNYEFYHYVCILLHEWRFISTKIEQLPV